MFPIVAQVDRLSPRKVKVFFTDGAVIEMTIPVKTARRVRIIDQGLAVKFGAGDWSEVSAWTLRERPGLVVARAPDKKLYPGQTWAFARSRRTRSR